MTTRVLKGVGTLRGVAVPVTVAPALALLLLAVARAAGPHSDLPREVSVGQEPKNGETTTRNSIRGIVRDDQGPVPGALVRIQATNFHTRTGNDGRFTIPEPAWLSADRRPISESVPPSFRVTAWASGYYIAGPVEIKPGDEEATIPLQRHTSVDHVNYAWIPARRSGEGGKHCQNCHSDPGDPNSHLLFDEWVRDAHSGSARNPLFLSMYWGTDLEGRSSPLTRFAGHKDYGRVPLPPDPRRPNYGPGFRLDFPNQAGNCATCHIPASAVDAPNDTDPRSVSGAGAEGVTCDLCHKVWDVHLERSTGLPPENRPGVLSMEFRRPDEHRQLFFGPLDDVAPGDDAYAPVYRESRYCAPCHQASFWGVEIYSSYREWLESPYSDPQGPVTCQDCHMPRRGASFFTLLERGGLLRSPESIGSHQMRGIRDQLFLADSVELKVDARRVDEEILIDVSVNNVNAGHHIPTDSPLRHVLLVVEARDRNGVELEMLTGPRLPEWAGDLAHGAGRVYAKVLAELWTDASPTGAYWNPIRVVSDTRIPAKATDESHYRFLAPAEDAAVTVRLIYRRAFYALARQKGWDIPDILMKRSHVIVSAEGDSGRQ